MVCYSPRHQDLFTEIPIERILTETDSPYLTPTPYRGKRNEPKYVIEVAKFVAHLRNVDYLYLSETTDKTAKDFFKIG